MAAKVVTRYDVNKPYGEDEIYSDREYAQYTVQAVLKGEDKWERDGPTNLTLYVDSETGVVVFDVEKYEKSLKN